MFLSYAHEWPDDAAYISQMFKSYGLDVWIDTSEMRTDDRLGKSVQEAIQSADYFASPWCIHKLEVAADLGTKVLPIKVSEGELSLPPHIHDLYEGRLGEPVFLDIRKRIYPPGLLSLQNRCLLGRMEYALRRVWGGRCRFISPCFCLQGAHNSS